MVIFRRSLMQEEDKFIQGLYEYQSGQLQLIKEDCLVLSADWAVTLKEVKKPILFVGNDLPLHRTALEDTLGAQAVLPR